MRTLPQICAARAGSAMLLPVDAARSGGHVDGGSGVGSITGAKVFSATRAKEREELGDMITRWLRANPQVEIVDKIVTQSSDREFHCLTVTLFYRERLAEAG